MGPDPKYKPDQFSRFRDYYCKWTPYFLPVRVRSGVSFVSSNFLDPWKFKRIKQLHDPRIFYPSGHWPETVTNAHVSAHFPQSLGASVISTHIRTEGLYVKTTITYQLKWLCVPDCAYTENIFINSIHVSLYDISLMQNISYQIKRDMAVWKILRCPQRNQWTWWQIVATPYTGLA